MAEEGTGAATGQRAGELRPGWRWCRRQLEPGPPGEGHRARREPRELAAAPRLEQRREASGRIRPPSRMAPGGASEERAAPSRLSAGSLDLLSSVPS